LGLIRESLDIVRLEEEDIVKISGASLPLAEKMIVFRDDPAQQLCVVRQRGDDGFRGRDFGVEPSQISSALSQTKA
jgi:hypothetical protein